MEGRIRVRVKAKGTARLQWRTEDQELFPKIGQSKSSAVAGGDWQELTVRLAVEGRLVHLRFFPPSQKQPIEIDWIEISPKSGDANTQKRWDFGADAKAGPGKPRKTRSEVPTKN